MPINLGLYHKEFSVLKIDFVIVIKWGVTNNCIELITASDCTVSIENARAL